VATGTGTKFYFPDQPQLRGKKIEKVSAYFNGLYPVNPDNVNVINANALYNGFLILYVNNREDIKIPLYHLVTQTASASSDTYFSNNGYIPFNELPIVWEKSYVLVPSGYTSATQEAFMFGVFYKD
jgi:hypothetical protein